MGYNAEKKKLKEELRVNTRALRQVRKKHKTAKNLVAEINKKVKRLKEITSELKHFNSSGNEPRIKNIEEGGIIVKTQQIPDWVNGIWIVAENVDRNVQMYKFFEFIREIDNYHKFEITLPHKHMIGIDGEEVTFNKGDLVLITHVGDIKDKGKGFHFANVGPSDEAGQLQLELARHKLGIGPIPCSDKAFLVVDGNFRKVN